MQIDTAGVNSQEASQIKTSGQFQVPGWFLLATGH
jgi:hypothetical protein